MTRPLPSFELDDPLDFTSPSLQSLDSSLRCQICHEFYTAPVLLTSCSHTFDSLCLRNHLKESKKCPQCSVEANEDKIKRNLVVEEVVNDWKKSRAHLLSLETSLSTVPTPLPIPSTSRSPLPPPPPSTRSSSKRKLQSPGKTIKPEPTSSSSSSMTFPEDQQGDAGASSDVEVIEDRGMTTRGGGGGGSRKRPKRELDPEVSTSSQSALGKGKGKGRSSNEMADPKDPSLLVNCPLCSKLVKNGSISPHIDSNCKKFIIVNEDEKKESAFGRLMGIKSNMNSPKRSKSNASGGSGDEGFEEDTTKYLALPNYAHKKVKEIETLLRNLGLPTTIPPSHSKSIDSKLNYLKKRHSQYLTLWNSNADIDMKMREHKNVRELKEELERWEKVLLKEEKEKEKEKGLVGGSVKGKGSTNTGGDHVKSREDEFKSLIEQARASHIKDKEERLRRKEEQEAPEPTRVEGEGTGQIEDNREEEHAPRTDESEHAQQETAGAEEKGQDNMMEVSKDLSKDKKSSFEEQEDTKMQVDENLEDRSALPISPPPQEAVELSHLVNAIETTKAVDSPPPTTVTTTTTDHTRRRTVRILTPPPISSTTVSTPSPSPLPRSSVDDTNGKEQVQEEERRRERSSSILEYDEKYFPPTSQRVREVDWEMVRKSREEENDEDEDGGDE